MDNKIKKVCKVIGVSSVDGECEDFKVKVFKTNADGSFYDSFPDKIEKIKVSRKKHDKLFKFLMNKGLRDREYISFDFIKKELKEAGE